MLLVVMSLLGDKGINEALQRMWLFAKKYWFISLAVVIWLTFFVHNNGWNGLSEAINIRRKIYG